MKSAYLVAPFWNDYDFRALGEIWYYNTSNTYSPLIFEVSNYVNSQLFKNAGPEGYEPFLGKWALVATWEDVPFYPHYWFTRYPQYYSQSYIDRLYREVWNF